MTARCGIDIIEIKRFKRFLQRSDVQQMLRIFTSAEWDYCQSKSNPLLSLAARFAIKEACMKLFPAETNRAELDFTDIEVAMNDDGAPYLKLNTKLINCLERNNLSHISISLSHTSQFACGMAITE